MQTISEIQSLLAQACAANLPALEAQFASDERKGVQKALEAARRRIEREAAEEARLEGLYAFERELAPGKVIVGLDEVGRGPLAGPLSIGAVVLDAQAPMIAGLNDSKQIPEAKRAAIAKEVKRSSRAYCVVHIPPKDIDDFGIMACLRRAFTSAISQIEDQGVEVGAVLLDGNPLGLDAREINVIKGDAQCASIAAASIIAKVERDALMVEYDAQFPGYDFASSKGYGSARHRKAILQQGLTPIHRASYCSNFFQPSLFS